MTLVVTAEPAQAAGARALAAELGIEFVADVVSGTLALHCGPDRLELREIADDAPGPVYVDWLAGTMGYRRKHGGGRGQAIARAIGIKAGAAPLRVLDATAGLGRDAFALADLGAHVTAVERSPGLFALLRDGWQRACRDAEVGAWLADRLTIVHGEAAKVLADSEPGVFDAVYLDPMHPARKKSALVKKEMRVLRLLAGDDEDAADVFEAALTARPGRIVVKRPVNAEPLAPGATRSVKGKTTRFDVYLAPSS